MAAPSIEMLRVFCSCDGHRVVGTAEPTAAPSWLSCGGWVTPEEYVSGCGIMAGLAEMGALRGGIPCLRGSSSLYQVLFRVDSRYDTRRPIPATAPREGFCSARLSAMRDRWTDVALLSSVKERSLPQFLAGYGVAYYRETLLLFALLPG
ncbi:hypothetical protein MTO96_025708 [Rhipicephalus appendiculatus]